MIKAGIKVKHIRNGHEGLVLYSDIPGTQGPNWRIAWSTSKHVDVSHERDLCVLDHYLIRKNAWEELSRKKERGYTEEQQKLFLAGLSTMWRLIGLDKSPLFTYNGASEPVELQQVSH